MSRLDHSGITSPTSPTRFTRPSRLQCFRSLKGALVLVLYMQLVLMIAVGPLIANDEHFHQSIAHGVASESHHHAEAIALADPVELGVSHVHHADSWQLQGIVAPNASDSFNRQRNRLFAHHSINYADIFLDGPLRPPKFWPQT